MRLNLPQQLQAHLCIRLQNLSHLIAQLLPFRLPRSLFPLQQHDCVGHWQLKPLTASC